MDNLKFVEFCKSALSVDTRYMWGTYGNPITAALIVAKAKQYPRHYNAARRKALIKAAGAATGCDCTGLIKWYLMTDGDITAKPKYNSDYDYSASGWYKCASVRGDISTIPETAGVIVSMTGHCGVYIGGGKVVECTLGAYGDGVVMTNLSDRKWEKWCECKFFDYITPDSGFTVISSYTFTNSDARTAVYADSGLTDKIGSLDPKEACACFGVIDGKAVVMYSTASGYKAGFILSSAGTVTPDNA